MEEGREQWDNKVQFFLALVGYAVGIGNVYRFPYLLQKNGGGVFLIPYFTMLVLQGIPLLALELGIGQRLRKGPLQAFGDISRYTYGMGVSCLVSSVLITLYYNTVMAWTFYYLYNSFSVKLPWGQDCPVVDGAPITECTNSSTSEYFWYRTTLNITPDINHIGDFNLHLYLCIFISWLVLCLCMVKGIKSQGKVIYFTSTFPYILLTAFFIKGLTLKGSFVGLKYMVMPDFSKLFNLEVWRLAAEQNFYSLGLSTGSCIAMASYSSPKTNFLKLSVSIAIINSCTSLYAAGVIFSVLGYIATQKSEVCIAANGINCKPERFLNDGVAGTGLAFMTMADVCDSFGDSGPIWAVLFYFMVITLCIDSQFGTLEAVFSSIYDFKSKAPWLKTEFVSSTICFISCLCAGLFALGNGEYFFQMFDTYIGAFPCLALGFFEAIAVCWVYGTGRFSNDIQLMSGMRPPKALIFSWMYVVPTILFILFMTGLYELIFYGTNYDRWEPSIPKKIKTPYPTWANIMCLLFTSISIFCIPLVMLLEALGIRLSNFEPNEFPVEEVRAIHPYDNYKFSSLEKTLFRITDEELSLSLGLGNKEAGRTDSTKL